MPDRSETALDVSRLRDAVEALYVRLAIEPDGAFHFHRGAEYAATMLGYDRAELGSLPEAATRSFAGAGNPHRIEPEQPGETILDIGSGTGMDLLIAAQRVGATGRVIGVDATREMVERCRALIAQLGLSNAEVRHGDAEALPVEDASADVVISNGVMNLVPHKEQAFREMFRALRPGGRLMMADIVVAAPLPPAMRANVELWAC